MAKLLGFDIHRYNHQVDPVVAKAAGINYALIRAGGCDYYGNQFTDNQLDYNSEVMPDHFPVGYWYVFRPNHSPQVQAEHFINLIRDLRQDIPAIYDVELSGEVGPKQFAANLLLAFMDLDAAFPGTKKINYTRAGFFNSNVARRDEWDDLTELWVARYTSWEKPWGNPYDSNYVYPLDYDDWVFWQWSADGNGRGQEFGAPKPPLADHDMDLDYFNGDLAAFNAHFNIGQGVMPSVVRVINGKNTTLRAAVKGAHEAAIPQGTRLGVVAQDTAPDGSIWYNVGGTWILADHVEVIE